MNKVLAQKLGQIKVVLMVFASVSLGIVWEAVAKQSSRAQVYLVSVGSGDPDNITLRAVNVIKDSDIIFCN